MAWITSPESERQDSTKIVIVTADQVKSLREKTGLPMMRCKQSLIASDGIESDAIEYLRKAGESIGQTLTKPATEGAIFSYVHHDGRIAAMVELRCQTDFVSRNESFQLLGRTLAMQVASKKTPYATFLDEPFINDPSVSVGYALNQLKAKTGENVVIGKIIRMEVGV